MVGEEEAAAGLMGPFGWVIRGLLTVLFAVFGCMLFAMIGSMTYPGIGALVGAIIGFAFWGLIGCCIVGFWKDFLPSNRKFDGMTANMIPNVLNSAFGGHPKFQLIVTVHQLKNFQVIGYVLSSPDTYISVECGNNPKKQTCVKKSGVFNEQFKLNVRPGDVSVLFRIMDQDYFGSSQIAQVDVKIDEDIIYHPDRTRIREFKLQASAGAKLRSQQATLELSFFAVGYDTEGNQAADYGSTRPRSKEQDIKDAVSAEFTKQDVTKAP